MILRNVIQECYTGINNDGSTSYNEELVGEALKPVREKVIIATKFGVQQLGTSLKMDSRPETIRKAVEGSLKRLGTHIDLYHQLFEELNIAFVAFSPMGNGFLSGRYKPNDNFESSDFRGLIPQYTDHGSRKIERIKENFDAGKINLTLDTIAAIGSKLNKMNFMIFGGH